MENSVLYGLITACRFAICPTRRSPVLETATIDGVVRLPSAFSTTFGCPPSTNAMHEFVVPRSIPRIFDILDSLLDSHNVIGLIEARTV